MIVMTGKASAAAFTASLGQRPQADAAPRSAQPVGMRIPATEQTRARGVGTSTLSIAFASAALLCAVARQAVGSKVQRVRRGDVGCRVVTVNTPFQSMNVLEMPPKQQAAVAVFGDTRTTPHHVLEAQPRAAAVPTDGLRSFALASEGCGFQLTAGIVDADPTRTAAAFGTSAPRQCRAARRVGAARCAHGRSSHRGSTARAAHRRCGAMLQRPHEVSETGRPAYDPSRVRAKIQRGLRSFSRPGRRSIREFRTAAPSESMGGVSVSSTATSNIVSIKRHDLEIIA